MTTLNITGPAGDGGDHHHKSGANAQQEEQAPVSGAGDHGRSQSRDQAGRQRKQRPHPQNDRLPTRREILLSIKNLPSLVAAEVITPAQHNSMLASLRTLLDYLDDGSPQVGLLDGSTASLQQAIRKNPDLLSVLGHLLSDEQLRSLADDDDSAAQDEDSGPEGS